MEDKNKIIIFIAVIIVLFVGLFLIGKPVQDEIKKANVDSNQASAISALQTSETFYDFGTISMKNGKVSKIFEVSNLSGADVDLKSITTSCMCTVAYVVKQDGSRKGPFGMPGHGGAVPKANELIKSGESRGIEVVYDPNAHGPAGVGRIDRFVYLEDKSGNKLQFEIKAHVTP